VEPLVLRAASFPGLLVVVRLGTRTLEDEHLRRSCEETHGRWGLWGFSVLEVPRHDYAELARLRPFVTARPMVFEARGSELLEGGFPLLPTLDHPHWTVVLSEPEPGQFEAVRTRFRGPIENPVWSPGAGGLR
jgi:hypothetical protein